MLPGTRIDRGYVFGYDISIKRQEEIFPFRMPPLRIAAYQYMQADDIQEERNMIHAGLNLEINPELIAKLSAGQRICRASHDDGSANRINEDAIWEAGSVSLGILTALFLWIRKGFRNRGKTKEELAAEKEADEINRTCGALEVLLVEYFQSAQKGQIDEESLSELVDVLAAVQGYEESGKLDIPGREDLAGIRRSIADYTEEIAESRSAQPGLKAGASMRNEFRAIRELLLRQKELLEA